MFQWNLMLRTLFASRRQQPKPRCSKATMKPQLEELMERILPSASPLPVLTVASPPAVPQVAAITSFVDSIVQQRLQLIATVVQDASNIWNTLAREIDQDAAFFQQQVGRILGINPNTSNPSSNAALSQPSSGSGVGQGHASGSGSGSGATSTAHENHHPRLDATADVSGSGSTSGSGPYSGSATVTGKVWLDNNGDGSIDSTEMDYAGDTVNLFVSTDGGSTWSLKTSTTTSNATQGYNYSLQVAYGYPWPSSYIYKIQVAFPSTFEATIPGTSQINAQGYSQTFSLSPGGTVYITGGLASMNDSTLYDDPNGPTQQDTVTLRDAVETGNNGGGASGLTNITFTNPLNGQPLTGTVTLQKALDPISRSYDITGPAGQSLTIQGQGNAGNPFRIFKVNAGVISTISYLTITGGYLTFANNGAGIDNSGNLELVSDTVKNNQCTGNGGGGGGIANEVGATLMVKNTNITGNSVAQFNNGGGILNSGTLSTYLGTQISGSNKAGQGAGIYNSGTADLNGGTIISGNVASTAGGGIYQRGGKLTMADLSTSRHGSINGNQAPKGGGIYVFSGTLTIWNGGIDIYNNQATNGDGGGVYIATGTANISGGSMYSNSTATGNGGGLYNASGTLTLKNEHIGPDNSAPNGNGGGAYLKIGSTTTFNDVTVQGNQAKKGPGVYWQNNGNQKATVNIISLNDPDDGGQPFQGP